MKRFLATTIVLGMAASSHAAVYNNVSGTWNTPGNWSTGVVPNAVDAVAQYANATNTSAVSLDIVATVGKISLENRRSWTINDGGGSLIMDVTTGTALIQGNASNQNPDLTINANIAIADPLVIQTVPGTLSDQNGDVIVNGDITGTGNVLLNQVSTALNFRGKYAIVHTHGINTVGTLTAQTAASGEGWIEIAGTIGSNVTSLTKTGAQNLKLLGINNAYTGGTFLDGGTITVDALSNIGGGALEISTGAVLNLLANQTSQGAITSLTLGSTLYTTPGTYGTTASGATFTNDTYFAGAGFVTILPVPEPASLVLLGFAGLMIAGRRNRI